MSLTEIVMILVGSVTVLGSLVTVVWVFSNRPTYKYCDITYQRIDTHDIKYNTVIQKLDELKKSVDALKNKSNA